MSLDCPHCGTAKAMLRTVHVDHNARAGGTAMVMYRCHICDGGILIDFMKPNGSANTNFAQSLEAQGWKVLSVVPKPVAVVAPAGTPDAAARYYVQGASALARGDFDAAGMMFRKTLEAAVAVLAPDGRGTLHQKIEALSGDAKLTPSMLAWAHHMRRLGNEASHELEPFSGPDAAELHRFAEVFLTYAFSLPSMIKARS